jgi:iron(III) transport system substrate-binding protein
VTQPSRARSCQPAIPENLRSPEGLWFALTEAPRIVYAHNERVAEGEVTTYEDLADPKWLGRICTRPGTHNYNLALLAAVIAHHGEDYARTWAEGVKANLAKMPEGNDRAQVRSIWAGECDISLGNTYYMGQMLEDPEQVEWAQSVRIEFPVFAETGGTHINVSGIAMTQSAPSRDEALQLMEFLVSAEAQAIYAEENHEYPVVPSSKRSELVASWGEMTPDTVDPDRGRGLPRRGVADHGRGQLRRLSHRQPRGWDPGSLARLIPGATRRRLRGHPRSLFYACPASPALLACLSGGRDDGQHAFLE